MINLFRENRLIHFASARQIREAARRASRAAAARKSVSRNKAQRFAQQRTSSGQTSAGGSSRISGSSVFDTRPALNLHSSIVTDPNRVVRAQRPQDGTIDFTPFGTSRSFRFTPLELREENFTGQVREQAVSNIRKSRPDLFLSDAQIRQKNLSGVLRQFNLAPEDFGRGSDISSGRRTVKANKQLAFIVRSTRGAQADQRNALIDQEIKKLARAALTERTREINREHVARVAREDEEFEKFTADRSADRRKSAKERSLTIREGIEKQPTIRGAGIDQLSRTAEAGESVLSPGGRAAADTLPEFSSESTRRQTGTDKRNTVAKEIIGNSPQLKREFLEYQDFLDEFDSLDEVERGKVLSELEQEAADLVDPFYDQQKGFLQRGVDLSEQGLEARKRTTIEDAQKGFSRGVEDLTLDVGRAVGESGDALNRRNVLLNSGIGRLVADRFIDSKDRGTRRLAEDLATTTGRAGESFQLGLGNLRLEQDIQSSRLDRARDFEFQTELGDIFNDLEIQQFQNKGEAATIPFQQAQEDPEIAPTGRISARNNPGTTISDRAELRKQERLIKNRQQAPKPQRRLPTVTQPTARNSRRTQATTGRVSASNAPGSTLQQRVDLRRNRRLSQR